MEKWIHSAEGELRSLDPYVIGARVVHSEDGYYKGVITAIGDVRYPGKDRFMVRWDHMQSKAYGYPRSRLNLL